jgi:predicted ATPase/DNA-binding SARP family transcriptional activator
MEVRLLGPLVVEGNGAQATLGGRQRRAVLALLALAEGRVVPVDALIDALWGERPPRAAVNTVQVHVSALRKALASVSDEGKETIVRDGVGYRLAVSPTSLDHVQFVRLTDEGGVLLSRDDAAYAREVLAEALALWRGPALADFEYEEWAQAEARRLEDLRLSCLEGRIEAELATGRHSELVGELEALVAKHPERERFTAQLLIALYRSGRQAEALDVYQRARERLVDELGIDPSPELQALNRGILSQDQSLISPVRREEAPVVKLPAAPTPIVGRDSEQAELSSILSGEGARLVTITGPGGVGKTRLAIEVASGLAELFPDGVFFVALAPLQDAALVPAVIANELGVRESADQPLLEMLKRHLRSQRALLVLDNYEHVLDSARVAAELLAAAPGVAVIATSRVPLRLYGEYEYALDPLALPDPDRLPAIDEVAHVESVALFNARARAANRRFELTRANAATVAEICARLDGLPLALELAAARVKLLPLKELVARLEASLPWLTGGPTDAPERHRTLRATIGWSHALLDERERTLFRRLAVFVGGCTIEAAEAVCGAGPDTLAPLIDANVLRVADVPGGERRFSMLRVIREYAAEQLEASGETERFRARRMAYLLELAHDADARMTGPEQSAQLRRVAYEHDNIRATLAWALEREPEAALSLVTRLQRFFYLRGYSAEGLRVLEGALQRATDAEPVLQARALRSAGTFAEGIGDFTRARSYLEDGVEGFRRLGDPKELAATLNNLGAVAVRQGDVAGGRAYFAESLEFKRELGDRHGTAVSLSNLAMLEARSESYELARAHQEEACAIMRELGDENGLANSLTALGEIALIDGRVADASALLREAVALTEHVGDRAATVEAMSLLARVGLAGGEGARARADAARAVALASKLDDAFTTIVALEVAADSLAVSGEPLPAVNLRATATRIRSESDASEGRTERAWRSETLERARAGLSAAEYERAWEVGATAGAQDALASAAFDLLQRRTEESSTGLKPLVPLGCERDRRR